MKKKMKKSRLSLCLVLMLLFVMLMPITAMAEDVTREEFDAFGPGANQFMIQTKVSTTDGKNDGYIEPEFIVPNDGYYVEYGNESKLVYDKEAGASYIRIRIAPDNGKKLKCYKIKYDNGAETKYGYDDAGSLPLPTLTFDGCASVTITVPSVSQTTNNMVSVEAVFEDGVAPGVPTNIRWDGKTVKWDAPASGSGVDFYGVSIGFGTEIDGEMKPLLLLSDKIKISGSVCEFDASNDPLYSPYFDINQYKCLIMVCISSIKDGVSSEEVYSKSYAQHNLSDEYEYDEDYHWKECVNCGIMISDSKEEHDFGNDSVCDVCGYVGTTYKFLEGMDGSWTQKSDKTLKFKADGEFSKFSKVKIDGVEISSDKYTASEGSTIIELKKDYLGTLSVGEHSITIVYTDGACAAKFKVLKATEAPTTEAPTTTAPTTEAPTTTAPTTEAPTTTAATTESEVDANPETGDGANVSLMFALLFLSGAGMMIYFSNDKKAKR